MMFYECTPGYCPCGERCTNQRFQRAEYAKVEPFKVIFILKKLIIYLFYRHKRKDGV